MNLEWLLEYNPVLLALGATLFTWGVTALGSAMVFFFKSINKRVLNVMLGFAAGVMIAASFWSLLAPSIEMAEESGTPGWIPAVVGFLSGGAFLFIVDKILPHLHMGLAIDKAEGIKTPWQRSILLVLSITIHNIPEGLAIGVAFGALALNPDMGVLAGAIALAIGIGLQNFPEGAAVSIPLRREGFSRLKAFNYSYCCQAYFVFQNIPYFYFLFFVVVEELIPESQTGHETDYSTVGAMIGFTVMMFLDVALA